MKDKQFRIGIPMRIIAVTLLVLSAGAAEKIQYKLNLEKGQLYYVRLISDSNVAQEMMGQETVTKVSTGFGYSFDVNDVDEKGNGWVDCTIDWVKFSQKSPRMEFSYDSSKQASPVPPGAESMAMFLGECFTVKISPQGHVEEFRSEKLRKNLEKKIPEGPDKQQMLQSLEQKQLANSITELYLGPLAIYPDKPVTIGDSWTRTKYLKTQPFIYESKWTLKARKDGIATIEESTTVKSDPKAVQNRETEMKIEMSGTSTGQIEIQESKGQILRSKTTRDMSGQMQAGPTTLLIKTHGITTFEMTERKPKVAE
jgi:hypothetical protein